jgi:predicted dehydrogenase
MGDERVRVVAVCDVNKEGPGYWSGTVRGRDPAKRRVDDFYKGVGCAAYEDFRDVIRRDDIDAIYIGTPDHWHAIIGIAAANAGKDVYGQKPLSLTIADGRAMVEAVKRNGIVWQTGSQQRSDHNFRRACELVRNGRIGKLQTVRCGLPGGIPDFGKTAHLTDPQPVPKGFNYDLWLGPSPKEPYCPARVGVNFRWNLNYSGGQITDWGGHHPDIAQWGMDTEYSGPIEIRNPRGKFAEHPIYDTATDYYFECIYENGVKLIISNQERGGVTFEGTEGWVWADRGRHDANPKSILNSEIGPNEVHLYKSDHHVKNFIDCMISRKETVAPIEVAHRSISLAHLGNIALILRRGFKWDPKEEKIIGDPGANLLLNRAYRRPWVL